MKSTHQNNAKRENKFPVKGPSSVQKGTKGEHKYIRSMVGVPSNNVGVQSELDPTMTLRRINSICLPTIQPSRIKAVAKMKDSKKFADGGQQNMQPLGLHSLPDEFASLDLNQWKINSVIQ
eukprot:Nitzschia sp. Nitz4//scaffold1_size375055//106019//106565//NITZ4_000241-RA/size375055-augustus-gene-0.669-mRNA-1//1//CDS//3329540940//8386//frame0